MSRIATAITLALACLLVGVPAAHADTYASVFDTVDAVEVRQGQVTITGLVAGQSTTRVFTVYYPAPPSTQECTSMARTSMSKPGKYRFSVDGFLSDFRCKLELSST